MPQALLLRAGRKQGYAQVVVRDVTVRIFGKHLTIGRDSGYALPFFVSLNGLTEHSFCRTSHSQSLSLHRHYERQLAAITVSNC